MGLFSCLRFLIKWTIIIAISVFLINVWLHSKKYLFSDKTVADVVKKYSDTKSGKNFDVKKAYKLVHAEFARKYPGHVLPEDDLQWFFFNSGGWMVSAAFIHSSVTEYIMFLGTAVESSGHSGRFWANLTDTVLTGEFLMAREGAFSADSYKPGETMSHGAGEVGAINFRANTWMVEYGRGFIPSTISMPVFETFFTNHDFISFYYFLKAATKVMLLEAGYYVVHPNEIWG